MGYNMVIYPLSMMRLAMAAVKDGLATLKRDGCLESTLGRMQSRSDLYELMGYRPGEGWIFPGTRSRDG